ncbi:MAG: hypothetical protein WCQ70_07440 [Lentimicrobiaceae bacterium]
MRNKSLFRLILLVLVLSLTSCKYFSGNKHEQIVAECYGQYLYKSDLQGLVPEGTTANDSVALTKQFIDNWIRGQIMLQQAEKNLTEDQKDFKDQLETYRNSLIIYAYESELVRQKLDTVITDQQIEEFYKSNQVNFQLRENIVRVNYVKIPAVSAKPDLVKKAARLLKSSKSDDLDELAGLCQNSMLTCALDDENWISFDALTREIPIKTDDQEAFLESRTFYETNDSLFVYLVNFKEYKTKEGVSPLSFETENIRNLILNRRKIELMDRMQEEIFQEALKNKEFTIY